MRKPSFKTVAIAAATTLFLIATVMAAAIAAIRIHDHREDEKSRLRTFHPNLTPNVINCDRILQNQTCLRAKLQRRAKPQRRGELEQRHPTDSRAETGVRQQQVAPRHHRRRPPRNVRTPSPRITRQGRQQGNTTRPEAGPRQTKEPAQPPVPEGCQQQHPRPLR